MDWSSVNWLSLGALTASAFVAALIGSFIGRRNYTLTALLTAVVFAALYVGWIGYLQQRLDRVAGPDGTVERDQPTATAPTGDRAPSYPESGAKTQ